MALFVEPYLAVEGVHVRLGHRRFQLAENQVAIPDDDVDFDLIGRAEHQAGIVEFIHVQHFDAKAFFQNPLQRGAEAVLGGDAPAGAQRADALLLPGTGGLDFFQEVGVLAVLFVPLAVLLVPTLVLLGAVGGELLQHPLEPGIEAFRRDLMERATELPGRSRRISHLHRAGSSQPFCATAPGRRSCAVAARGSAGLPRSFAAAPAGDPAV